MTREKCFADVPSLCKVDLLMTRRQQASLRAILESFVADPRDEETETSTHAREILDALPKES